MADAMEEHYGRKPSNLPVLGAHGTVIWWTAGRSAPGPLWIPIPGGSVDALSSS